MQGSTKRTIKVTRRRGGAEAEPVSTTVIEEEHDGPEVDPAALQSMVDQMRSEQNVKKGIVGGLVAAGLGAGIWAGLSVLMEYQLGLMAIGVGLLAGYGVRLGGKGLDPVFGVIGALCALLGCFVGNAITVNYFISAIMNSQGIPGGISVSTLASGMVQSFGFMDLIFYAIATYEGYQFAFRRLSHDQLSTVMKTS
jgi:hypothetical protein